jgi:predicted phosphate transport protein (TIGR00153 family)
MPFQVIPRELVFYDLLEAAARNVAEATGELVALIDEVPSVTLRVERIRELEHRGDDLTHEIISTLNQTFVVPLDRHDIHRLASALDDIVDFDEGVAELIELLPIKEMFPGLQTLVGVLAQACGGVVRAISDLRYTEALPPDIAAIKREEREGDFVYRRAIAELYREDFHPLEVLMWKDLLHQVESAIDRCEDVANQIESVVAKFR